MAVEPVRLIDPSDNVFQTINNRSRAAASICLHLLIYNYAMLALATSLPTFMIPQFLDFSVEVPHLLSVFFPLTSGFIAYISASFIFTHVNLFAEKHLIPVPRIAPSTEEAYPLLSAVIIIAVSKEVMDTLGGRHAWIWTLRLGACCVIEALFLFLLLLVCSTLFPKFGEGMGSTSPELYDNDESYV